MVRRRAPLLLAALVTAVLTLVGCGGAAEEEAAAPIAYDPPTGFGAPTGRLFGGPTSRVFGRGTDDLPATLAGTSVWVTDGGRLQRVDSAGAATTVDTPPGRHVGGRPRVTPDRATVLAAAAGVVPGSGTTPPGLAAELLVVDPSAPAVTAAVPATLAWNARPSSVRLRVAGVAGALAVFSAATDDQRTTVGVDLAARRVLWVADGVDVTAVISSRAGPVAVGVATAAGKSTAYTASSVVGLDAATGARRFVTAEGTPETKASRAGPSLVAVGGRDPRATSARLAFVSGDGDIPRTVDLGTSYAAPRCVWDEASVTVCSTAARVFAVDARSGADLWSLPDPRANRVAPEVTAAWHGAVYGSTVNGPVVLDARTGADRDVAPGAAPVLVNGYLGIATQRTGVAGVGGGAAIHPAVR